jgi:hypothetical protein
MRKIILPKDELYDMFINKCMGCTDIGKHYGVYKGVVVRNLNEYNIHRTPEQYKEYRHKVAIDRAKQCEDKYGGNGFASKELRDKAEATTIERYGGKGLGFKNPEIQAKARRTIQNKYGVTAVSKLDWVKEKITNTTVENYGVSRALKLDWVKEKQQNTMLNKYGNRFGINVPSIRQKMEDTYESRTGYKHPLDNPEVRKKINNTFLNKYGSMPAANPEVRKKINNTIQKKYHRKHQSQTHYSDEVYVILTERENFIRYIETIPESDRTIYNISKLLNVYWGTVFKYVRHYDLMYMFPNNDGSLFEKSIVNFIKSLNVNYLLRTRTVIPPYELDVYIPEYNLAIECNGTFWHSTTINKNTNYHYNKSKLCEEKGIRLIHIFEYEWNNQRQRLILENIIRDALNKNTYNINIKECTYVLDNSQTISKFLRHNCILDNIEYNDTICIYHKDNLLAVLPIVITNYNIDVIICCNKLGYSLYGDLTDIFKYIRKTFNKPVRYFVHNNYFCSENVCSISNIKYLCDKISYTTKIMDNKEFRIFNAGIKEYLYL